MSEYHKIETLFVRDEKTFKVHVGEWRLPEFAYLADNQWNWTEKVDGTNIRAMWDGHRVMFGGRTDDSAVPTFLLQRLMEVFTPARLEEIFAPDDDGDAEVYLYGEGYGARIQRGGGNYKPDGVDIVLFDVKVGAWWLQRPDVKDVADKLSLTVVPTVGTGTLHEAVRFIQGRPQSTWGAFPMEGLVLRPATELKARSGHRIIAKIKHKDFA